MTQLNYQIYYLMIILLCTPKIRQTLDIEESGCSIKTLSPLRLETIGLLMNRVVE